MLAFNQCERLPDVGERGGEWSCRLARANDQNIKVGHADLLLVQ